MSSNMKARLGRGQQLLSIDDPEVIARAEELSNQFSEPSLLRQFGESVPTRVTVPGSNVRRQADERQDATQPLRRRTRTMQGEQPHSEREWQLHKDIIRDLYEAENRSLQDVKEILSESWEFRVSARQLRERAFEWGLTKTPKKLSLKAYVAAKAERQAESGKETDIHIGGSGDQGSESELKQDLKPDYREADTASNISYHISDLEPLPSLFSFEENTSFDPNGPFSLATSSSHRNDSHDLAVHSEKKPTHPCDARFCERGPQHPFSRKELLRQHLRNYHREDIGRAKREKQTNKFSKEEMEAKWQRDQRTWINTRNINRRSWRCNKCLTKIWVAKNGWICPNQACNQPCEEERIQARLGLLGDDTGSTPKHKEREQEETVSVQDDGESRFNIENIYNIFLPRTSRIRTSPLLRGLQDEMQEEAIISLNGDVPFTDSGYRSAPNLDARLNSQPELVKSPCPFSDESLAAERFRFNDDAKTTYSSGGSTVDPGYAQKYIVELCNDIYGKTHQSVDTTNGSALTAILPELIKAFALKLCHDSPSKNSRIYSKIMYFIHKRHKEIATQLEAMFHFDDEDEPDCDQRHLEDMSILDKMSMWNSKDGRDISAMQPESDLFEGVQDDEEDDPIDHSELSAYHKIIVDSTAYEWFLMRVATETIMKSDESQPRIRQQILDKLPTGTVSKRRNPIVYKVKFGLKWPYNVERNRQYSLSEELQRRIQVSRSSIIMTGSPLYAQGLSIEQYLEQTWPEVGLLLLNALDMMTTNRNKNCSVRLSENTLLDVRILVTHILVVVTGPAYFVADCGELWAWIGPALFSSSQKTRCYSLPQITSFQIDTPSSTPEDLTYRGDCYFKFELTQLETCNESLPGVQNFSRDLLGENTIILGFPIRRRPEGYPGLEVSFHNLLRYLQASTADIFAFDAFIKGPKRVLKLIKHTDDVFLWQLDHTLADHSICAGRCSKANAIKDYSSLDYHALVTGRHILSKCADDPAPPDDADISSPHVTTAQNLAKPQDVGSVSRSSTIERLHPGIENVSVSPHAENAECAELLSDDLDTSSVDSQLSPRSESLEDSLDSDMFSISESPDDIWPPNSEETFNPVLNDISLQLLAGFRRATESNLSPNSGGTTSSTIATTNGPSHTGITGNAIPTPRPIRKRGPPQDEDGGDSDDESPPLRRQKLKRNPDDEPEKWFACPFFKWNPTRYGKCCMNKISRVSYVKQHLYRDHTPKRYCQACQLADFPDEESLESHIKIGKCTWRKRTMLDGISNEQRPKLCRKSKPNASKEEQWYAIWEILFAGEKRPSSIYIDTDLVMTVCQFREHCERHGPTIIREQIESDPAGLSFGTTAEERQVIDRLIARGISILFDTWASRTSLATNSPENPRYETPTNSLVDSGVMMGGQSPVDTRFESSRILQPSRTSPVGFVAQISTAETRTIGLSTIQDATIGPYQPDIPRFPAASLGFTAEGQAWETGDQINHGFEPGLDDSFDLDDAFQSPEDVPGHLPRLDQEFLEKYFS